MHESAADLDALQALLDASFAGASDHLTSIMTPERRLSAHRLVAQLPTPAVLAIATVTARGEPRISAVDGHFLQGSWQFTTPAQSPKGRHLAARPAISASYTPRDGFGVFAHGRAVRLGGAERQVLREHFLAHYGSDPDTWGSDIGYYRIDAQWLVAFAMTDEEQRAIDAKRT